MILARGGNLAEQVSKIPQLNPVLLGEGLCLGRRTPRDDGALIVARPEAILLELGDNFAQLELPFDETTVPQELLERRQVDVLILRSVPPIFGAFHRSLVLPTSARTRRRALCGFVSILYNSGSMAAVLTVLVLLVAFIATPGCAKPRPKAAPVPVAPTPVPSDKDKSPYTVGPFRGDVLPRPYGNG